MIAVLRRLLPFLSRGRHATKARLEQMLGESIRDLSLYEQALRHRSIKPNQPGSRLNSNERLEFLGDAVLGLVVAEYLYELFPGEMEGFLTPLRAKLVKGSALTNVARSLSLGAAIEMSSRAAQHGGRDQDALLADALEAVIGALYLDRGLHITKRFIHRSMLEGVNLEALAARQDNFKSLLQEYAQARGWPHPTYTVVDTKGPPHSRVFKVAVDVGNQVRGKGHAPSKKEAEQLASRAALSKLKRQETNQTKKKNYKGQLHQLVQARGWPKPQYRVIDQQGPPHSPTFTVEVQVGTMACAKQQAGNKKEAEHKAARKALEKLAQRTANTADR